MRPTTLVRKARTLSFIVCALLAVPAVNASIAVATPTIVHTESHGRDGSGGGAGRGSDRTSGTSGRGLRGQGLRSDSSGFGASGNPKNGMRPDAHQERSGPAVDSPVPENDSNRRVSDQSVTVENGEAGGHNDNATCSSRAKHCDE